MRFSLATNRPTHLPTLLPVCPTLDWNFKKIWCYKCAHLPARPAWTFTKIMCPPSCPPARPFTEAWSKCVLLWQQMGACLPARPSAANDRQRRNRMKRWWTEGWTTVNDGKRQKLKAAKSRREAALKTITACRLPPACLPLPSKCITCRVLLLLFWRVLFWRLLDKEHALWNGSC